MRLGVRKKRKSIFRKAAIVFVIVALVPISVMGLRGHQTLADEMRHLVDTGKVSPEESAELLRTTDIQTLAYAGYGLVVALVLGYFFAASVVRPIRALQAGARRIGSGDLDFRVETDTEDELEELATTLNNMAAAQKMRQAELNSRNGELEVLYQKMEARTAELNQATEEIASLISEAESHKSFSTRYQNNNLVKCWLFKHCRFKQCPAYGSANLRCWQIAGTHCGGEVQGVFAQKLGHCEKCEVLQHACPDKITLLGETFNNMMAILEQRVWEQKELQQRLYRASKLAAIGELAAGVAHEINNPLTGILASAMLLKSKTAAGDDALKNLSMIESEALRARDIVRNLLDFAHQGSKITTKTASISRLIEQTLFLMRHQTEKAGVKVRIRLDDKLPQLNLDVNQMKQVFINIIQNAVQAMPGGGNLAISAGVSGGRARGRLVEVEFADDGTGIEDSALARIFDPFFTTKRVGEGTGLGLSVSHRIVSEHGGEIRVKSEPLKGSTFTVVLPLSGQQKQSRQVA